MDVPISDEKNLNKVCVSKKGEKDYFPKTIPRERKPITFQLTLILLLIFAVHICFSEDWIALLSRYAAIILIYMCLCLVYRFILLKNELEHSVSRYGGDNKKIYKAAFHFDVTTYIFALFCFVFLVFYCTAYCRPSLQDEYWWLTISFLFFLHRLLDLENFPINDSLFIAKGYALDYGSGMAYSFFYGYLNYMLDKIGNPNKNLKEMMQDYESANGVRFAVYKIFILIPKSLECFESIQHVSNLMEMRSTLPEKKITVAGVRDRVYKHSVYTIRHPTMPNGQLYVCSEYATPLKTFKEVVKHRTAHTEYYDRHKNDILLQFYLTLKQILEQTKMNMMCELVYYEDMDDRKRFHDVGRILLSRIAKIKKDQSPKDQ